MNNLTLRDVTFVVPTNRDKVYTLDSIPEESEVFVEDGTLTLNEARNSGVRKAKTSLVIVCDDDIVFSRNFIEWVLSQMSDKTLIGLKDYYPMKWCIGRFMCFWKEDWEMVGGFDESRTRYGGDDTDFCIRMKKIGVEIKRIPRDSVEHVYEEKDNPASSVADSLLYLLKKHPKEMLIPCIKLTLRKIGLIGDKNE